VQKLQAARRDLQLEAAIAKLDRYHLLILDDIAYVTKDQAETSVIFELIAARYERRSLFITSNQPFEPPRVCRRLFCLGHAARAAGSSWV
jgi:DNA replication protein DnaC